MRRICPCQISSHSSTAFRLAVARTNSPSRNFTHTTTTIHPPARRLNYQSKFLEFADTLFMVLRKKNEQISWLHMVHHAEMGPLMRLFCAWGPSSLNSGFGPSINSAVHTLMYAYYGLTGLGYKPAYKILLTAGQIAQFFVIMIHAIFHLAFYGAAWDGRLAVMELLLMIQVRVGAVLGRLGKRGGPRNACAPRSRRAMGRLAVSLPLAIRRSEYALHSRSQRADDLHVRLLLYQDVRRQWQQAGVRQEVGINLGGWLRRRASGS